MALCECGCGKDAGVYKTTTNGHTKGQPKKFLRGHSYRNPLKIPTLPTQLCECGCGMDAGFYVARPTKPRRFIAGHQAKTANAILHALPKVRKTHCPRGHEKTPENTSNGGGCKTCARLRFHERQLPNHCIHGHEKTLENTTKTGACKVCAAIHMKRRYGLSSEQFDALLEKQENKCAICRVAFDENCRPCIDHRHDGTANARGLLCITCNAGLGSFRDNVETLKSAIYYLEKTQCNQLFTVSSSATVERLEVAKTLQWQPSLPNEDTYMTYAATASQAN